MGRMMSAMVISAEEGAGGKYIGGKFLTFIVY